VWWQRPPFIAIDVDRMGFGPDGNDPEVAEGGVGTPVQHPGR
jgi:hypothetical protein